MAFLNRLHALGEVGLYVGGLMCLPFIVIAGHLFSLIKKERLTPNGMFIIYLFVYIGFFNKSLRFAWYNNLSVLYIEAHFKSC